MIKIRQGRRHDNEMMWPRNARLQWNGQRLWASVAGARLPRLLLSDGHGMVPNCGLDLELVKNDCCFENRFVKKPACWFQSCCSQLAGSQLNGQLAGLAEVGVQHS